ncbi:hypothetical protein CVT26_009208 [Gymnopilus dilepis]|uniref:JmjC domain-containing protein n=1 Tax=Gymnopilus dilepis TaxID=231916 RepID=A0A409WCF6_9AGAR|nr:hypothetical protein CVT26_009208 [Gymnopilus dilepis]
MFRTRNAFSKATRSTSPQSSTRDPAHPSGHLLKLLAQLTSQDHVTKVAVNFILAALFLSYALQPNIVSRDKSDLSEFACILEDSTGSQSSLSSVPIDEGDLDNLAQLGYASPHVARLALQIACLISPILLLLPSRIAQKNPWSRENLYETAWCLGNQKPDLLLRVERVMWQHLIHLATVQMSLDGIIASIRAMLDSLPWEDLENLGKLTAADIFYAFWLTSIKGPPISIPGQSQAGQTEPLKQVSGSTQARKGLDLGLTPTYDSSRARLNAEPLMVGQNVHEDTSAEASASSSSESLSSESQNVRIVPEVISQSLQSPANTDEGNCHSLGTQLTPTQVAAEATPRTNDDTAKLPLECSPHEGNEMDVEGEQVVSVTQEQRQQPIESHKDGTEGDLAENIPHDPRTSGGKESGSAQGEGDMTDFHSSSKGLANGREKDPLAAHSDSGQDDKKRKRSQDSPDGSNKKPRTDGGKNQASTPLAVPSSSASDSDSDFDPSSKKKKRKKRKNKKHDTNKQSGNDAGDDKVPLKDSAPQRDGRGIDQDDRLSTTSVDHEVHPVRQSEFWAPLTLNPFEAKKSVNLDILTCPPIFKGKTVLAYGLDDNDVLAFEPRAHDRETLASFSLFQAAVESAYVNGKPPHINDPQSSVLKVLTEKEFMKTSPSKIQETLRSKCIVITDRHGPQLSFDESGLRTLGALHKVVTIHGTDKALAMYLYQSIPEMGDGNDRRREGTLYHMLDCSEQNESKILKASCFPRPQAGYENDLTGHISTDASAWISTEGDVDCKEGFELPTSDMRWGVVDLRGAIDWIRIDSDGLGTFVELKTGCKYWIILKPKKSRDLARIGFFFDKDFNLRKPSLFQAEAILLRPGMTLIMPPNTPHVIYTPENTICWGGHYYATGTMQSTLFGIVHSFINGQHITDVSHHCSRLLLRRIICFYYQALIENAIKETDPLFMHVPHLKTIDSALDLLSLCALGYLANALDLQTYLFPGRSNGQDWTDAEIVKWKSDDLNSMPKIDRKRCTYARGMVRELIAWFVDNHIILHRPADASTGKWQKVSTKNFALSFIADQLVSIKRYKESAVAREQLSSEHSSCSFEMFALQVDGCLHESDPLTEYKFDAEASTLKKPFTSLGFSGNKASYRIQKTKATQRRRALSYSEIDRLGISRRDVLYYAYLQDKQAARWIKLEDLPST